MPENLSTWRQALLPKPSGTPWTDSGLRGEGERWNYYLANSFILTDSNLLCALLDFDEILNVKVDTNRFLEVTQINVQHFEFKKSFIDAVASGEEGATSKLGH